MGHVVLSTARSPDLNFCFFKFFSLFFVLKSFFMGDVTGLGQGQVSGEGLLQSSYNDLQETEYYTYEKLMDVVKRNSENDITVFYANVRSLPKRGAKLNNTLAMLNFSPDIIALTETKITTKVNTYYNPYIENYTFYESTKSNTVSGGVGVFVKNSLHITIRDDLDLSVPGLFETLWFDVEPKQRGKRTTVGVFYRHHGITDIPYFERRLETSMSKLNANNTNYHLFGDFNINSLLYREEPNIKSFVDMMHANSAVNLINKPTRFPEGNQHGSPSLLDHYYTNSINLVKNVGLLIADISDHLPIFTTISMHAKKVSVNDLHPYIRDYSNFNSEAFNESIRRFNDIKTQSLDSRFYNFNVHLLTCINEHIPLRKRTKREIRFAMKPWISNGLKRSINERRRLYNLSRLDGPQKSVRVRKYNKYKKNLKRPSLRHK